MGSTKQLAISITVVIASVIFTPRSVTCAVLREADAEVENMSHQRFERAVDMTTMLIGAAKAFILGGGVETLKGNPDKMGALQSFVSNYAVRSVLGDGLVGRVLGGSMFGKQPTTITPSGVLGKLFGGNSNNGNSNNDSGTSSSGGGSFLSKLFGRVTTTTTTTTPSPEANAGFLMSLAKKFLPSFLGG